MIFFLSKILSYRCILACAVGYSNRGNSEAVARLCIEGLKKVIKVSSAESSWYVKEYFKYAVPALLKSKDQILSDQFLSLITHEALHNELLKSEAATLEGVSQIFYRQRNLQEALRYIVHAVEKKPDDAWIQFLCGWCYVASQKTGEALPHLKKAIELDSSYKVKIENDSVIAKDSKIIELLN